MRSRTVRRRSVAAIRLPLPAARGPGHRSTRGSRREIYEELKTAKVELVSKTDAMETSKPKCSAKKRKK